ncbi:adenosine deaminase 2-like [Symsagittifera roscoffensis]|uniref:adenosine deaminase 2-like n=1 Tax=Symsagittifera roscoffensis TaxID=84072 RepID=UPI00307C5C10
MRSKIGLTFLALSFFAVCSARSANSTGARFSYVSTYYETSAEMPSKLKLAISNRTNFAFVSELGEHRPQGLDVSAAYERITQNIMDIKSERLFGSTQHLEENDSLVKYLAHMFQFGKHTPDWVNISAYETTRSNLIDVEWEWRFGSSQHLTENDNLLNKVYVERKAKLLEKGFDNETLFRHSEYFTTRHFTNRPTNAVYEIIRRLPKGALLHAHQSATHDLNKYPKLLLSIEGCKICEGNGTYVLNYFDEGVNESGDHVTCRKCPTETNKAAYKEELKTLTAQLSMYDGTDYNKETIQYIWDKFENKFGPTGGAKDAFHVWKVMLDSTLDLLVEDNIQYAEFRTGFGDLMLKNGTVVPYDEVLEYLEERIEFYRKKHPNFYGINYILSKGRVGLTDEKLRMKLEAADKYFKSSDLVRGFDLVGSEESGRTLKSVLPVLLDWRNKSQSTMPFVFHAGETLWTGFESDQNVIDAVMLKTKRIGHGYALDAHPLMLELVRELEIGLELNPISNQVLALVDDLRNHRNKRLLDSANKPGLLSNKPLRFSVNSDDCLILGTKPMTDDLYALVMAMTHKHSDLRVLKRMAYDSIYISLLTDKEKALLTSRFEREWNHVVKLLLEDYKNN